MAPIPKKTYSRVKVNETSPLNDSDPFDKLLSSPLKQDVTFKPLSFWNNSLQKSVFQRHSKDSSNSSLDSTGGGGKWLKLWKCQRVLQGIDNERTQGSHLGSSNLPDLRSSVLIKNNKSSQDRRKSLDIGLDHYQYITIKRGLDYRFPCLQKEHPNGSHSANSVDSEKWKTYIIDNKNACVECEEDGGDVDNDEDDEDSTLKCTVIEYDENNNTTWNMMSLLGTSGELDDSPDKTTIAKTTSPQPTESIGALVEGVSHLKITSSSPPQLRNITTRRYRTRHTVVGQDGSTSMPRDTSKTLRPRNSLQRLKIPGRNSTAFRGKENMGRVSQNELSFNCSRFSGIPQPMFESTRIGLTENDDVDFEATALEIPSRVDTSLAFKPGLVSEGTEYPTSPAKDLSSCLETSIALKPGKRWWRSMSILRKLNGSQLQESNCFSSPSFKGRRYKTFVEELIKLQEEISDLECTTGEVPSDETCDVTAIDQTVVSRQEGDKSSMKTATRRKTMLNRTVKIMENVLQKSSAAFRTAMENQSNVSVTTVPSWMDGTSALESSEVEELVSAKEIILEHCRQTEIIDFEDHFNETSLKNCRKIGEGVYGEVFMRDEDTVFKVIPIEGDDEVNGEPQKKFEEILSEVIIAAKLSDLRENGDNQSSGFSKMKRCWCVKGKYPKRLLDLWKEYDAVGSGSENDSPEMFNSDQVYIVLELENGGKDLESFEFNSAEQSLAVFVQATFALAVAERVFEFEHRDLHWGNLLIRRTQEKYTTVVLDGVRYDLPTKGVLVSIIDFTLSRILHAGCCLFNDLSLDPTLFISQGDYQFEVYRMMKRELGNDWSLFRPRNNIYWLHYILDKMLKMVRYKNKRTQTHKKYMKELKLLESVVLEHENCSDFILSMGLGT